MDTMQDITFIVPREMGEEMKTLAKEERRSISELMAEAFRSYRANRKPGDGIAPGVPLHRRVRPSSSKNIRG